MNLLEFRAWRWVGLLGGLVVLAMGCASGSEPNEPIGTVSSALTTKTVDITVTSVKRGVEPLDPSLEVVAEFGGFTAPPGAGQPPGQRTIGSCNPSCDSLPPSSLGAWTKTVSYDPSLSVRFTRRTTVSGQLIIRVLGGFQPPTFQRCFHFKFDPSFGEVFEAPNDQSTCPGGSGPEAQLSSIKCAAHTCTAELKIAPLDSVPWILTFDVHSTCAGIGADVDCDDIVDGCVPERLADVFRDDVAGPLGRPTCDGIDNDCNGLVDEDFVPYNSTLCDLCTGLVQCVNGAEVDPCVAACKPAPTPTQPGSGWKNPAFVFDFDVGGDTLCYAPALSSFGRIGTITCTHQSGESGAFPTYDLGTPDFLTQCPVADDPSTAQNELAPCYAARVSLDPNGRAWASATTGVFVQVGEKLQRVTSTFPAACSALTRIELVGPADRTFQGSQTARPFGLCNGKLFELDLTNLTWVDRSIPTPFAGTSPSHAFDLFLNAPTATGSAMFDLSPTNQTTGLVALGVNRTKVAVGGIFAIGNDFTGGRPIQAGTPARDPGLISQWTGTELVKVADVTSPLKPPSMAGGKYNFLSAPTTDDGDPSLSFVHQKVVEGGGAGVGGPSPAGTNDIVWVMTNTSRLYVYNLPPITQDIRDNLVGDDKLPVTAFSLNFADNPPVALCRDVTIDANASCTGTVTAAMIDAGSSDPDGTPVTAVLAHPSALRAGVNQVELVVSDGTLSATCWSNVTLRDTIAPVLSVPSAVNVKACGYPAPIAAGQATATDGCTTPVVTGQVIATNGVTLATPIPVTAGSATLLPGTHTIEWAATDGANTARKNQTVTVGVSIESSASFLVGDRAQVKALAGGFAAVFNAGTGTTRIGNFAKSGGVLSRGPVDIQHHALVDGAVTGAGAVTVASDATVNGVVKTSTPVTLPAFGTLPSFPAPIGLDRTVNAGTSLPLAPGSYPSVTVNGSGTLVLGAGDYYFTGLIVNALSTVRVTSTTRIFVKNTLGIQSSFTANGQVQAIYLGFAGTFASLLAPFEGTLLAPAARVVFGNAVGMTFTGSFFVRDIDLSPDAVLVCRPG